MVEKNVFVLFHSTVTNPKETSECKNDTFIVSLTIYRCTIETENIFLSRYKLNTHCDGEMCLQQTLFAFITRTKKKRKKQHISSFHERYFFFFLFLKTIKYNISSTVFGLTDSKTQSFLQDTISNKIAYCSRIKC